MHCLQHNTFDREPEGMEVGPVVNFAWVNIDGIHGYARIYIADLALE